MNDFLVCIACLSSNTKMCSIENIQLPKIIEKLANITLSKKDGIPKTMCYICYSQLKRCCKFVNMSQKAGTILTQLLSDGVQISQGTVSALDERLAKNFVTAILKPTSSLDGKSVEDSTDNEGESSKVYVNDEFHVKEIQFTVTLKQEPKEIDEQITIEEEFVMIKEEPMEVEVEVAPDQECKKFKKEMNTPKKQSVKIKEHKALQSQIEDNQKIAPEDTTKKNDDLHKPRRKYTKKKNNVTKNKKNHACNYCEMKFSCKAYLIRHFRVHTGEKPFACKSCDKTFTQNSHLVQHMRVHTGEKPYSCHICKDKAFNHRYNYQTHMRKHFGVPSHACNMCNSAFHQKGDLKRHIMSHTGEKPYTCNTCNMKFTQNCHLTKHMKLHTRQKPHECTHCGLGFDLKQDLDSHIIIHTDTYQLSCPLKGCSKSFLKKGTLTNHIKSHTATRPFECHKCNRTFKQKGHLTKHTIIMHDNMLLNKTNSQPNQDEIQLTRVDVKPNKEELLCQCDLIQNGDHSHDHGEEYIIP